jgi:hypothetical protein
MRQLELWDETDEPELVASLLLGPPTVLTSDPWHTGWRRALGRGDHMNTICCRRVMGFWLIAAEAGATLYRSNSPEVALRLKRSGQMSWTAEGEANYEAGRLIASGSWVISTSSAISRRA